METIKVEVYVDKTVAVARGETKFGSTTVEPTGTQLADLTIEQRTWLFLKDRTTALVVAGAEWPFVVQAMNSAMAKEAAEKKAADEQANADRAKRWEECERMLARGTALWFHNVHADPMYGEPAVAMPFPFKEFESAPRVVEMFEKAKSELPATIEKWVAARADKERAAAEVTARREAERRECESDARAFILSRPDIGYSRAATEGKDVGEPAFRASMADLRKAFGVVVETLTNEKERKLSNDHAYSVADRAKSVVKRWHDDNSFAAKYIACSVGIVTGLNEEVESAGRLTYARVDATTTILGSWDYFYLIADDAG